METDRITRIRRRYLDGTPRISIQRARCFTESWKRTRRLPQGIRVALAMKNVYENMGIHVDPDDRIAGTWTEFFLGIPVDIEKGTFNNVFASELRTADMAVSRFRANARFFGYLLKQNGLDGLAGVARTFMDAGVGPPDPGLKTLGGRDVNPYRISAADRRVLLERLLPYWRGRTVADMLEERLRNEKIYPGDMAGLAGNLPTTTRLDKMIAIGASIAVWQGHLVLDHEQHIRRGLLDMQSEIAEKIDSHEYETDEERDYLESAKLAIEGVMIYARRLVAALEKALAAETEPGRAAALGLMLEACRRVPLHPAESFRQAVQSYWTVKTALELAVPFNVHAPGRIDQYLYPYYIQDIEQGRITKDETRELLEELFLKIMSHNMRPLGGNTAEFSQRFEGSEPVTLGGMTPSGDDATNELTYLALEAAEHSKASLNFVVRLHRNSPGELYMKLAEMYHRGISSVSMMNDEISVKAMVKRGFTETDARNNAITGCVDLVAPGKTGGEAFSAMLMCRVLDTTLRNGDSMTFMGLLKNVGIRTGDPDSFSSFDQFVDAYIEQGKFVIGRIVEATRIRDGIYAEKLPAPHISAFMGGCLDKKKDVTRGGAVYDIEGILFMTSIANTVDALYVIKKLIFERRGLTFKKLLRALDRNYRGYEDVLKMTLALDGRWGNGNPESDEIAARITKALFEETAKHTTYKGGWYAPFINSMTAHTIDGRMSLATPDGRPAGAPFAPSCSPCAVEKNGATGALRSIAAIDFTDVLGCAVNIRLHPSAIGEDPASRQKWISLVKTYFAMGGQQLQPNVVSTDLLRRAQKDPESYRDIIVKVGGYSAYFTDLGAEIQNEIISRTEHSR